MPSDPDLSYGLEQAQNTWTASTTEAVVGAKGAGKRINVDSIILSATSDETAGKLVATVTIKSGSVAILGPLYLSKAEVYYLGDHLALKCAENAALNVVVAATGTTPLGTIRVGYYVS
jgi:hypothetical protein